MKVRPMTFIGDCQGCNTSSEKGRAAVAMNTDTRNDDENEGDEGEWLCTTCADKLAKLLTRAAKEARAKVRAGYELRWGKWVKKGDEKKAKAG